MAPWAGRNRDWTLPSSTTDGCLLPDGEEGHVALKVPSPHMMLGYWKDPERTAACYVEGPDGRWYLSGDRGSRDADG